MPKRLVNIYIDKNTLEIIDRMAREKSLSRSELVRAMIEDYVRRRTRGLS